jgi:hypothetical protein
MSRTTLSIVLGTALLALGGAAVPADAQVPPPVAGGIYDSFGREKNPDNTLPRNDRVLKIERLKLGGLRVSVFDRNGKPLATTFLVQKCAVSYDGQLASYYQNFETVPPRRGIPVEQVTFVFRINDPIGDYDVYFRQPGGPLTSEVIKRR